ncbi:cytosine permease [Bacillus sp. H-16]|uniref:cytosine permease n=1 Tax=Alteribacter salitolerans TaxID=2912333 RepID=UPI001963CAE3|nr:cytosine permease [Alteribacter salitolerans]
MRTAASAKKITVETIGLDAVPKHLRTTGALDYVRIKTAVAVNAGNFLVPAMAVLEGGLNFYAAVLSTVLGACLAFLFVSLLALPGARYGLPAQFVIRSMIGTKGSMYIASPIRTLTSLYWFGVQTIGGTYILKEMLSRSFGLEVPFLWLSIPLALIMAYLALVGFEALKNLSKFVLPLLFLSAIVMACLYLTGDYGGRSAKDIVNGSGNWSASVMILFGSLAFVQYVSGAGTSSDVSRYGRTPKHAFYGIFFGNSLGFLLTALLGAFTATVAGDWNPFVVSTRMTDSFFLIALIFTAAFMSMITINLNNAYTGGYSLLNSFPKLGRMKSAVIFGALGVIVSGFPIIADRAEQFISLLGTVIIPLTAVFIADYLVVKKGRLSKEAINNLAAGVYSLNVPAAWAVGAGVIIYLLVPGGLSPSFITFFVTPLIYLAILQRKGWNKKVKKCA